jgi:deoxyadenosine/deoxycytidine kinase
LYIIPAGKPELALHITCDDTVLLERIMKRGKSGDRPDDNFHTVSVFETI